MAAAPIRVMNWLHAPPFPARGALAS